VLDRWREFRFPPLFSLHYGAVVDISTLERGRLSQPEGILTLSFFADKGTESDVPSSTKGSPDCGAGLPERQQLMTIVGAIHFCVLPQRGECHGPSARLRA
jgi:hypothetical protein